MARERWWPNWHPDKVDAFGREVGDLELKILGCLYVLGTGNAQFQVSENTDCPMRNVVKQVGRKSMSFLVAFLYCYAFDACTIFLRRSYVHTYIRSMLVNLDTLADGALIVVSPTIGDALNVVSLTLSIYDLSCK
jgi:hypothetical protein